MKAVIVGGGLGGLAAALSLQRAGWQVEVLEQAAALTEVGAGIQISPNGTRVLEALGVMPKIEEALFQPDALILRRGQSGRTVFSIPIRRLAEQKWRARYFQIHRADMLEGLRKTLEERSQGCIRLGRKVTGYSQSSDKAFVHITGEEDLSADLVVGADGIHSVIRTQMIGPDRPRYTGNLAWRAVVPMDRLGDLAPPPSACVWAGAGKHAVTTRIRGGQLANFVGIVERPDPEGESWTAEGNRVQALADFGDWHPVLRTLIEQADHLFRWGLYDRAPLPRWSDGRVVLLGDAAHPMLPSMAQGAVQAFEDAWVLAQQLPEGSDVSAGCAAYNAARIGRASRIQAQSARNLRMFHGRVPAVQAPLWMAGKIMPSALLAPFDWIYGHDVTQL